MSNSIYGFNTKAAIAITASLLAGAGALAPRGIAINTPDIEYLDQLAECSPFTSPAAPMPFVDMGLMIQTTVQGWDDELCVVEHSVFVDENPSQTATLMLCQYSPATLAIMTDEVAYEQVRTGNASFSTNNERDLTLSEAMTEECEFNETWIVDLQ